MDHEGFCYITQGDAFLTELDNKAVTALGDKKEARWRITRIEGAPPGSHYLTIALTTGVLDESREIMKVLTVGGKVEHEEGIQIYLEPLQDPPPKKQLWTLEHVIATKRFPPLILAHIQSAEYPDMSAGVADMGEAMPKLYRNVAALPNKQVQDDEKWSLDYFLP